MTIPAQIQQLVDGSGNTFHAKVARWFQSDGWHIRISPYYMDQTQSKAREIDLVAEKMWPMKDMFGHWRGDVVVRLYVECKFVPSHAVFWFADKDVAAATDLICEFGAFTSDNRYTQEHHYLSTCPAVAKVFASESNRGQDFEPFYKALNQVLNAQVSMRDQSPTIPELVRHRGHGQVMVMNYPVVVCSSFEKLFSTKFFVESTPTPIQDNFQLEVQYAYADSSGQQHDDYFLVDFVEFSRLPGFVLTVAKDAETAAYLARSD
jgi:hypothetical protein